MSLVVALIALLLVAPAVANDEPDELVELLRAIAVVGRVNVRVARHLSGREDADVLLHRAFERDLFLSMDADPTTLNAFIAGELKRWTAFFQASGFKPQ